MWKETYLKCLIGVAVVALALLLTDRLLWQPGLTEDNVRSLRPGMTLAEVEALLGGPAADTFEMPADYPAYRWRREWRREAPWRKCCSGRTGA